MRRLPERRSGGRRRAELADRLGLDLKCERLEVRELLTGTPTVVSVSPLNGSLALGLGTNLVAKFNMPLNPATVTPADVYLQNQFGETVPATVTLDSSANSIALTPSVALQESGTFTATVKGGASGVLTTDGTELPADVQWSFTTGTFVATTAAAAAPGVKIDRTNGLLTNAAGGEAVFSVVLTSEPTSDVTIPLASSNPSAGLVSTSTVVFTPMDWNVPQAVIVSGAVSPTADGNTTYNVRTGPAVSADPSYQGMKTPTVVLVNQSVNTRARLEKATANEAARFAYNEKYAVAQPMPMMQAMMSASMMATQSQVLALVPVSNVTNMVVQSGKWSNPDTWSNRQIPANGANVWVMPGRTLTVDGEVDPRLHTIRVSGTLNFSTTSSTSLEVDTIEVDPLGSFVMGTTANPILNGVTANITFTDNGAIDRVWDPYGYSRGLLSQGSASIVGAAKTGSVNLQGVPAVGATAIRLASVPAGWQVGDTIVIPGTSGGLDEQFRIAGISTDGLTVTLSSPVALRRNASATGMSLVVSNLTRNINFSSENSADPSRRGHVMFMHNDGVIAEYAAFNGLGRTNFSIPINNAVVDKNGFLVPGTGTNPKGRYAFHIHMAGTDMPMDPIMVVGCVVNDSASWGFDNHSSNVDFEDNVAYNTKEAGFSTETGNEIGTFNHNVAIRGGRVGFWLNGPYVTFTNNVASGFSTLYGQGVEVWAYSNADGHGDPIYFDASKVMPEGTAPVVDPLLADGQIRIELLPFHLENTLVYNSWGGIEFRGHRGDLGDDYRSTVDGGAIWGTHRGLTYNYCTAITVNSLRIYGDGQFDSSGIYGDLAPSDLTFNNIVDVDWGYGITFPPSTSSTVSGGFFNNTVNFYIGSFDPGTTPGLTSRTITITGVTLGKLVNRTLLGASPNSTYYNIYLDTSTAGFDNPLKRFLADRIFYDGHRLFYSDQSASTVVTGTGNANYDGKTNAQVWSQYGVTTRGTITPAGVTTDPTIYGGFID